MKYLVTGAAGFLGYHLCESILSDGHEVIGLDDFTTGSEANVKLLTKHQKFSFLRNDVRDFVYIESDVILNFACPASPVHYQADPVKTLETSVLGMRNLLSLAKQTGATVLQASTSEIYGDPLVSPQKEDYWGNVNTIGIRSCYDEGKRAAETLCFDYRRQYGVDARLVRIFNTYGPNMAIGDGRVVSNFIIQALQGKKITLYGDGSQTRAFCYVSDLIRGIRQLSDPNINIDSPFNLGNPAVFTMEQLANLVINLTDSKSQKSYLPLPLDDPRQRMPDIRKAKELFGWFPQVDLEQGLKNTIQYFQGVLS